MRKVSTQYYERSETLISNRSFTQGRNNIRAVKRESEDNSTKGNIEEQMIASTQNVKQHPVHELRDHEQVK